MKQTQSNKQTKENKTSNKSLLCHLKILLSVVLQELSDAQARRLVREAHTCFDWKYSLSWVCTSVGLMDCTSVAF